MAFYIMLNKVNEDDHSVTYHFGSDSEHLGIIDFDKHYGTIKEIKPINIENYQHLLIRAGVKLRQHWKAGKFPEHTCWAS